MGCQNFREHQIKLYRYNMNLMLEILFLSLGSSINHMYTHGGCMLMYGKKNTIL